MNRYKVRHELRTISLMTEKRINDELLQYGHNFRVNITEHVADRLIDRSTNVVRDIRNINYIMQRLSDSYLCNLLYFSSCDQRVLVYTRYKNIANQCFALGCTLYKNDENRIVLTARTFMPDFKVRNLQSKVKLEIKDKPKLYFNVNSPLQRMIYSDSCPPELLKLRRVVQNE